jgi:hypothetical protein
VDWSKVTGLLEPERHTAIRPAKVERGDLSHLAAWVGQQHEGNRNDGLFWAACRAAKPATRRSWPSSRPPPGRPG